MSMENTTPFEGSNHSFLKEHSNQLFPVCIHFFNHSLLPFSLTILLYPPPFVRWSTWCILWSSCWWCWWVSEWRVRPSSTQMKTRPGCLQGTSSSCLTGWSTERCLPTRLTVSSGPEHQSFGINIFFLKFQGRIKRDVSDMTEYALSELHSIFSPSSTGWHWKLSFYNTLLSNTRVVASF